MAKKKAVLNDRSEVHVRADEDSGLWDIFIKRADGNWYRVGSENEEQNAEEIANDLARWRRGE